MFALQHSYRVLSWQENLAEDEMPPEWMWPLEWEIEPWFEEVKAARDEKYGKPGTDRDESVPMMENEYAARMRR